ncbi:nucleotidyltransferase domain-containing protein [bacterium]|nr:nucleotidyltransferase domain-containing protein [bacterium]
MLQNTDIVPDTVIDVLKQISYNPKIERLILYGSRAIGDHDPRSDVDIAVVAPTMNDHEFQVIKWMVMKGGRTLHSIDFNLYTGLPSRIRNEVDRYGVVLYERSKVAEQS